MRILSLLVIVLLAWVAPPAVAQAQPDRPSLPRLIRFTGTIANANGTPRTGVVGVMFSLYSERQGGSALWTELQNVTLDANGQYTILLGSQHAEGVPADLFAANEARWLGIQIEAEPEQQRVLLVSVPYALKAGDAETLGGLPLSAFMLNPNAVTAAGASPTSASSTTATPGGSIAPYSVSSSTGTANMITRWIDSTNLGDSVIFQAANGYLGVGTTSPSGALDVRLTANGPAGAILSGMTLNNSAPITGNVITAMSLVVSDLSTATNLSKQTMRVAYIRDAAATGGVSAFDSIITTSPTINSDAPYTLVGVNMEGPTIASGKTLGTYYALLVGAPAGGTVTNKYALITAPGAGSVGINTTTPTSPLTVAGTIESTTGGFKFPDGSVLSSGSNATGATSNQVFHVTQTGAGAGSLTVATLPTAIRGDSTATSNYTSGVLGTSSSSLGFGVVGENLANSSTTTDYAIGVFGVSTQSTIGAGVWGEAEATTGTTVGVFGKSFSGSGGGSTPGGTGVYGYASATTGDAVGVYGLSNSTVGTGVWGDAAQTSGATFGIYGTIASADIGAAAGVFDNTAASGNILIGRAGSGRAKVFRIDTTGKAFFNGGQQTGGADFAESVDVVGRAADYTPGDLLIIDAAGYRRLALSSEPYSTKVAGIYSTKPGVLATTHMMDDPRLAAEVPLAVVGIVPCKVTAENGPIEPGDMLVSSSVPGYAMKGTDRGRMLGAVVGKAMQSLHGKTGVIEVLVSLH